MNTKQQERKVLLHVIGRYIDATIDGVENPTFHGDMVPQFELMGLFRRAVNCHLAVEVGLKALIERAGGTFESEHGLRSQLNRLETEEAAGSENQGSVALMRISFDQAVEFYGFNPNKHTQFRSLDDYLDATGGKEAYKQYRYWLLSQSLDPEETPDFCLELHIEVMHTIRELLAGRKQGVCSRIETVVGRAITDSLQQVYFQRQIVDEHAFATAFVNRQGSFSQAFTAAVAQDFELQDEFAELVFRRAHGVLRESTDTAVRHFLTTRSVLPAPPKDIPTPRFVEHHEGNAAEVLSPGGTQIGWMQRRPDGLWWVDPWHDHLRTPVLVRKRIDGLCHLVRLNTVEVTWRVAGEPTILRRMIGLSDSPLMDQPIGSHRYQLEMWDDCHGARVGQEINSRWPYGDDIDQVLEGKILEISEHTVTVQGSVVIHPRIASIKPLPDASGCLK